MKTIISNDFQIGINKAKYIHDKYNIYFDLQNLLKQIYEDNRIKIKYVNQNNTPITKYDSINNYYVILLNYNSSVALNNFNIALQLGHILLNHKMTNNKFIYNYKTSEDIQAKGFALEFLLPKEIFIIKYNELDRDVYKLAKYFEVSPALILVAMIMYKIK